MTTGVTITLTFDDPEWADLYEYALGQGDDYTPFHIVKTVGPKVFITLPSHPASAVFLADLSLLGELEDPGYSDTAISHLQAVLIERASVGELDEKNRNWFAFDPASGDALFPGWVEPA